MDSEQKQSAKCLRTILATHQGKTLTLEIINEIMKEFCYNYSADEECECDYCKITK